MKKLFILIIIFIFLLGIYFGLNHKNNSSYQTSELKIGTTTIIAEIADTPNKRELGLSGRKNLPIGKGMLFIFDQPGQYGFWMKKMNFAIDIFWLDDNKKIIGSTKNILPNSYPKIFYPPRPIKYVLEANPS